MKLGEGVAYIVAQVAGGIAGAYLLYAMIKASPYYSKSIVGLGADGYGTASKLHVSQSGAFLDRGGPHRHLRHGRALRHPQGGHSGSGRRGHRLRRWWSVHLIGIPLTGTSVNPARCLGPALVVGGTALSQVWLFLVAPLVGALVAAILHWLLADNSEDATVEAAPTEPAPPEPSGRPGRSG